MAVVADLAMFLPHVISSIGPRALDSKPAQNKIWAHLKASEEWKIHVDRSGCTDRPNTQTLRAWTKQAQILYAKLNPNKVDAIIDRAMATHEVALREIHQVIESGKLEDRPVYRVKAAQALSKVADTTLNTLGIDRETGARMSQVKVLGTGPNIVEFFAWAAEQRRAAQQSQSTEPASEDQPGGS